MPGHDRRAGVTVLAGLETGWPRWAAMRSIKVVSTPRADGTPAANETPAPGSKTSEDGEVALGRATTVTPSG